jgi:hypothetical protein
MISNHSSCSGSRTEKPCSSLLVWLIWAPEFLPYSSISVLLDQVFYLRDCYSADLYHIYVKPYRVLFPSYTTAASESLQARKIKGQQIPEPVQESIVIVTS